MGKPVVTRELAPARIGSRLYFELKYLELKHKGGIVLEFLNPDLDWPVPRRDPQRRMLRIALAGNVGVGHRRQRVVARISLRQRRRVGRRNVGLGGLRRRVGREDVGAGRRGRRRRLWSLLGDKLAAFWAKSGPFQRRCIGARTRPRMPGSGRGRRLFGGTGKARAAFNMLLLRRVASGVPSCPRGRTGRAI